MAEPWPDIEAALGTLDRLDVDAQKAEAICRQAQAVLARRGTSWGRLRLGLGVAFERLLAPAFVSALAAGYLLWACTSAASLLGWRL